MLISGGQTGVDRAALDFALQSGIPCSGWCPAGRRAEDGVIPAEYLLIEAGSALYQHRTRLNVRDSDATMIITGDCRSRGTSLTLDCCHKLKKPFLIVSIDGELQTVDQVLSPAVSEAIRPEKMPSRFQFKPEPFDAERARSWLHRVKPAILNLAGPRASECPAAGPVVAKLLEQLITPSDMPRPEWPPRRPFTPELLFF